MSIANGFIKSKRFRTLSDLTHKLESLWTAADTVEYTDADLSGVSVANTRPVSILDEEDFNDLTTSEKNNGYIYYVYSTDATTGKTTSYIYTKGITYGVGDPSVELTWAEYQALPSTKETDGITYYITDRDPSESISIGAENVTYGNTTVDGALDDLNNPAFIEASTRANIASGDSFSTILGKIKKFFTDLATVAFTGAYADLSGTPDMSNVAYKNANNNFSTAQTIDAKDGTTSAIGGSWFNLGNSIPAGTAQNSRGVLRIYGSSGKYALIFDNSTLTDNRNLYLPDKSGTIALTSDLNWIFLDKYDVTTTDQTLTIPSGCHEILLVIGRKNSIQVFGGKSFIIPTNDASRNIINPGQIYSANAQLVSNTGGYFYLNGTTLTYRMHDIQTSDGVLMRVYYR